MKKTITTLEEARQQTYGHSWQRYPYKEGFCVEDVWERGRGAAHNQCRSKNGHGPGGLYCAQHAKEHDTGNSATWYEVETYFFKVAIKEVEITAHTDAFVWVGGRKNARAGKYGRYFPTREEAKTYLVAFCKNRAEAAASELEQATKDLNTAQNL